MVLHISLRILQFTLVNLSLAFSEEGCDVAVALQSSSDDAFLLHKPVSDAHHKLKAPAAKNLVKAKNHPANPKTLVKAQSHAASSPVHKKEIPKPVVDKVALSTLDQDHLVHGRPRKQPVHKSIEGKKQKSPIEKNQPKVEVASLSEMKDSAVLVANASAGLETKAADALSASASDVLKEEVRPPNLAEIKMRTKEQGVPNLEAINATIDPAVVALTSVNASIVSAIGSANQSFAVLMDMLAKAQTAANNVAVVAIAGDSIANFIDKTRGFLGNLQSKVISALDSAVGALQSGMGDLIKAKDNVYAAFMSALDKANVCAVPAPTTALLQQKSQLKAKSAFWPGGGTWPWGCGPVGSCLDCATIYVGKANRSVVAAFDMFDDVMQKTNSTVISIFAQLTDAVNGTIGSINDLTVGASDKTKALLNTLLTNNLDQLTKMTTTVQGVVQNELPGFESAMAQAKTQFASVFAVSNDMLTLANSTSAR